MRFVQTVRASSKREPDKKGEIMNQVNSFAQFLPLRDRIVGIDQMVPVLDGSMQPYINLDNAASTPVLREVLDTVNQFIEGVRTGKIENAAIWGAESSMTAVMALQACTSGKEATWDQVYNS